MDYITIIFLELKNKKNNEIFFKKGKINYKYIYK